MWQAAGQAWARLQTVSLRGQASLLQGTTGCAVARFLAHLNTDTGFKQQLLTLSPPASEG